MNTIMIDEVEDVTFWSKDGKMLFKLKHPTNVAIEDDGRVTFEYGEFTTYSKEKIFEGMEELL